VDRLTPPLILRRELGEVLEVSPAIGARGARVGGRTGYRGRRLELSVPRDLVIDERLRRLGISVGRHERWRSAAGGRLSPATDKSQRK
jgi:hypothetical protein